MSDTVKLTIGHLLPDLLNLYGDSGNILSLKNRLVWRGMEAEVIEFTQEDTIKLSDLDIVILGGGSDREQKTVSEKLRKMRGDFADYIEDDGVLAAFCGGFHILGNYWETQEEKVAGLELLDINTDRSARRMTGNVVLESDFSGDKKTVVGFENHSGSVSVGEHQPFGKVLFGNGNNGNDLAEGVVYKNVLGTNLFGPLLPKNPHIADELIRRAALRKYGRDIELEPLCDTLEEEAHSYIVNRFVK